MRKKTKGSFMKILNVYLKTGRLDRTQIKKVSMIELCAIKIALDSSVASIESKIGHSNSRNQNNTERVDQKWFVKATKARKIKVKLSDQIQIELNIRTKKQKEQDLLLKSLLEAIVSVVGSETKKMIMDETKRIQSQKPM
jgi:hypothetical protein